MSEHLEELAVLRTIYPELEILPDEKAARLELQVALQKPLRISNLEAGTRTAQDRVISHLPPIVLHLTLPTGYPTNEPPLVQLRSVSSWLPEEVAGSLEAASNTLWEDYNHEQMLFAYICHVQEAIDTNFGLERWEVSEECQLELFYFDSKKKREEFKKHSHICSICLEPKAGPHCHQMEHCGHIFCVECLQNYYNNAVVTGDVQRVQCLAPNCGTEGDDERIRCGKKARLITPRELLQIPLQRETVQRYVHMIRKKLLEADRSTIWCPRQWCQSAAKGSKYPKSSLQLEEMDQYFTTLVDNSPDANFTQGAEDTTDDISNDEQEQTLQPRSGQRLAICEECDYAFCNVCHATWHGDFVRCQIEVARNRARELDAEELASRDYIDMYTKPCPHCKVPVSQNGGCNHMQCLRCDTHFCYLCSGLLDADNWYQHVWTTGTRCRG